MSWTTAIGAIGSALSAGTSLVGSLIKTKHDDHWNQKNLDFQKEQFQYQKYLNNNQMQIQASDAQKAGINPLAMNGGSLTAGNYSNQSTPMDNPLSGVSSAILDYMNMRNQKQMNEATNEANSANVQKQLDMQYKVESEKLAQQNYQFEMDYILRNKNLSLEERKQSQQEAWNRYMQEKDFKDFNEQVRHNKVVESLQIALSNREERLLKSKLFENGIASQQKARELFDYLTNGKKPGTGGWIGTLTDLLGNSLEHWRGVFQGKGFNSEQMRFADFYDTLKEYFYNE